MKLSDKRLDNLLAKIDNYNRNKLSNYEYVKELNYIDPNRYLDKLDNNIDHVIFGRRGSGKTTLLQKSIERKLKDNICVLTDCELLKDDDEINILIHILQNILRVMKKSIDESAFNELKKKYKRKCKGFTGKVFKILKKDTSLIKKKYEDLNYILTFIYFFDKYLSKLSNMVDKIEIDINHEKENISEKNIISKRVLDGSINIEAQMSIQPEFYDLILDCSAVLKAGFSYDCTNTNNFKEQTKKSYTYKKIVTKSDLLNSLKQPLIDLFNRFYKYYDKKIILFLDDYYYINKNVQPLVIKYIHQINKLCLNNLFSFKLCSLPNRFKLNKDGEYDLSIEDDFSSIDIDRDLSDLDEIKDFLLDIMCALSNEEITPDEFKKLFSPQKEIYYLIVACGGNPRDFMNFTDLVIREGRKNNKENITRKLIYYASHKSQTRKENSIEDDSILDKDIILKAVGMLKHDFLETKNTNVFLYPIELNEKHDKLLKSLLNLGYIHILKEEIVSDYHGKKTFVPYLIDMSLYVTNSSMKRGFDFREFWNKDNESRLINITSAPMWKFPNDIF